MTMLGHISRLAGQAVRPARRLPKPTSAATILTAAGVAIGTAALVNHLVGRDAELGRPPTGGFLTVDGVRLHYIEKGRGPVVLLIHGNGTSVEDWVISEVFDRLGSTHRVIAIDRPGFGYSERPRTTVWSADAQAALLAGALRQLEAADPILVGHSWGSLVALALALDAEVSAAGLVLVSGYYFPDARADTVVGAVPAIPILGDVVRYTVSPIVGRLAAASAYRKLFAPATVTPQFAQRFPLGLAMRPSQIRATAADTGLMVPSAATLADRYDELDLPVTILAGEGDRIVDVEEQPKRLHAALPGSELKIIPGVGHMVQHSTPAIVAAAVRAMTPK